MTHKLNPEVIAHNIANAFCQKYVSSLDTDTLEDSETLKEAYVIYANAYDVIYEHTLENNAHIDED